MKTFLFAILATAALSQGRASVASLPERQRPSAMFQKATPVMIVDTIEPVLPFWVERLGFERTIEVPDGDALGFLALQRDGIELMFQTWASVQQDAGHAVFATAPRDHTPLFFEVSDLKAVQRALQGAQVLVLERKTPYGSTETIARTPYGQVVTFAQFR